MQVETGKSGNPESGIKFMSWNPENFARVTTSQLLFLASRYPITFLKFITSLVSVPALDWCVSKFLYEGRETGRAAEIHLHTNILLVNSAVCQRDGIETIRKWFQKFYVCLTEGPILAR